MKRSSLLLVIVALAACSRAPEHHVDRIQVVGATVSDNAILAMTPAQVQGELEKKLKANGHFVLKDTGKTPPRTVSFEVELSYTREAKKQGREGTWAEVGATAEVKRRSKDDSRHEEIVGLGEVQIKGESLEERQEAVRKALDQALSQLVASADLMLTAHQKTDKELEKDLKSKDSRVSEFAIRALAERRNPIVVDALLEKLRSNDGIEVRRAIGALVELREKRAVPVMIELARNRDASFLREIVYALGAIGGEEAEAYLFTVASGHDQPEVQAAAEQAMAELRARASKQAATP